jgi:hypothetical protein
MATTWWSFRLKFYIKSLSWETVDNEFFKKKKVFRVKHNMEETQLVCKDEGEIKPVIEP